MPHSRLVTDKCETLPPLLFFLLYCTFVVLYSHLYIPTLHYARLYVSPQLPPTPVHKKMTPHQWLSEGHHREEGHKELLSLDDVRKNLVQDIDEAEDINEITYGFNTGAG